MKKLTVFLTLLILLSGSLFAQQPQLPPLPTDPNIRYGVLDNGLTYYIRHNDMPKQRADFYIVQKVGAILENDDQNGLAHFLEHMSFNGTQHFPNKGIINFLQNHGVKFGENINAYTALDQTVYNLSDVPTTTEGVIDSSLLVLHDWSHSLLLTDKEIDAERGVIMEEWRTRSGADMRMWTKSNKLKFPGSQYAKRDVIGDTAVIQHFKYNTLRDYYAKWYRPDLQGIIVVGDINVDEVEAQLKKIFADVPKPVNPAERVIYTIDDNKDPIVAIVTDPEARMTRIELEYKHDKMPKDMQLSVAGYAIGVINSLVYRMMSERFDEITNQANAPFVGAYANYGELVKSKDAFDMIAVPKEGQELEGLDAILLQAQKLKKYGFTASELERAKADYLKSMEKAYNERNDQKNDTYVREYIRNFLDNEPIPGIETEYQMAQAMLPKITVAQVNQLAQSYVTDSNLIVTIMAPEKATVKIPTKTQVLEAIDKSETEEIEAPKNDEVNKPLMDKKPKAGKIKKITENKVIGTTEMTLSNGIKVVFKSTTFKKDEILMSAYSDGGLSLIKNVSDLPSATLATSIVSNNGIADFSATDLSKALSGKIADVSPYISKYSEGMSGNSSVSDLETMLQLTYLYFTAPRKDDNAYEAMINMYKTSLANAAANPNKAFSDTINEVLSDYDPRTVLMNLATLDKVNQDKAIEIYKERFANPADFTFVFVGNIDPKNKEIQNLVATYLGGLKTTKAVEKYADDYRSNPKGKVTKTFTREMTTSKASNFIYFSGKLPYDMKTKVAIDAIENILSMRYIESIREREGGSYGVGVRGAAYNIPYDKALIYMQFDTDPAKEEKMLELIYEEVNTVIKDGPLAEDLTKVKENFLKKYSEDIEQNSYWKGILQDYYEDKLNYATDYAETVKALDAATIQKTLKALVEQGNVIEVVMKSTK